jgi:K+-sensing histidine kinase KdpD
VLQSYRNSEAFASLFFCAIVFNAGFGGYRQGLLVTILSALAFDYFFLPPIFSLAVEWNAMPRLFLFALSALMISFIAASQRGTAMSHTPARNDLAVKVQELKRTNEALHAENAERKSAEAALRRGASYLAEAQRLSQAGRFGWRVSTGEIFWSEETFRIFQYAAESKP